MAVYSSCPASQLNADAKALQCSGCATVIPADLMTTSCTAVPVGQYSCCGATSSNVTQPTCSAIENQVCSLCAPGQYSATGSSPCTYCMMGKFSYSGMANCIPCVAGRFKAGAVGVCTDCPAGTYSPANGATVSTICTSCSSGLASVIGSASCTSTCTAGSYSGGLSPCANCASGQYQPLSGALSCIPCRAGKFQPSEGQARCENCSISKFAAATGNISCAACAVGLVSNAGALSCFMAVSVANESDLMVNLVDGSYLVITQDIVTVNTISITSRTLTVRARY